MPALTHLPEASFDALLPPGIFAGACTGGNSFDSFSFNAGCRSRHQAGIASGGTACVIRGVLFAENRACSVAQASADKSAKAELLETTSGAAEVVGATTSCVLRALFCENRAYSVAHASAGKSVNTDALETTTLCSAASCAALSIANRALTKTSASCSNCARLSWQAVLNALPNSSSSCNEATSMLTTGSSSAATGGGADFAASSAA